jgi:hypothetical protein
MFKVDEGKSGLPQKTVVSGEGKVGEDRYCAKYVM